MSGEGHSLANADAIAVLDRAVRRVLTGRGGGDLPYDLTGAVLEAAIEVFGDHRDFRVAEINEMFGLTWSEPSWVLPLSDLDEAIGNLQENLFCEGDLVEFLMYTVAIDWSRLASSRQGTATMMSHGRICLYDFTVDDGVYFFVLAERDVCDPRWWFAHTVNDQESRAEAIRIAQAAFCISEI